MSCTNIDFLKLLTLILLCLLLNDKRGKTSMTYSDIILVMDIKVIMSTIILFSHEK